MLHCLRTEVRGQGTYACTLVIFHNKIFAVWPWPCSSMVTRTCVLRSVNHRKLEYQGLSITWALKIANCISVNIVQNHAGFFYEQLKIHNCFRNYFRSYLLFNSTLNCDRFHSFDSQHMYMYVIDIRGLFAVVLWFVFAPVSELS